MPPTPHRKGKPSKKKRKKKRTTESESSGSDSGSGSDESEWESESSEESSEGDDSSYLEGSKSTSYLDGSSYMYGSSYLTDEKSSDMYGSSYMDSRDQDHDSDRSPRGEEYEGDVSTWGRKRVEGFYDRSDCPTESSDYTLSSGLSPRSATAFNRPFDLKGAKKTLAYNAGIFARAQALRREGKAPHTLGIADDLPDRFAYHQLNQLSGMASKVQKAIEHNKRVFEVRMKSEDKVILKKAFDAWRSMRLGTLAQQQLMRRVLARMARARLARAFFTWKDKFKLVDANLRMRRRVQATINRGRISRCFFGWMNVLENRWWTNQMQMRDRNIHILERKIAGFELRPIVILKKRRTSAILYAWWLQADERRRKRLRFEKAVRFFKNRTLAMAWNSWWGFHMKLKRDGDLLKKAAMRMKNINLAAAWYKWIELIEEKRRKELAQKKALRHWANMHISKAWRTWQYYVQWRKDKKMIINRWKNPHKAKAFYAWVDKVQWKKRMRVLLDRVGRRFLNSALWKAWDSWKAAVEDSKMSFHMSKKEELAAAVKELQEENERLRRDNERFVRLIDSGEWGRGRVAELVGAGEVLKGERDALLKLIQSMRREYEAVHDARNAQEDEAKALKDRMMLGGAARNRMLVKGGSSFNALVRAMKQDLVSGEGTGAGGGSHALRDPNLLYEVDKLSMDRVTVFPDGELNIEAMAAAPGAAAFMNPVSSSREMRPHTGPVQPVRMPQRMPGPAMRNPVVRRSAPNQRAGGPGNDARYSQIMSGLQNLTPAERDRFERALMQEIAAGGGAAGPSGERGPPGMASTGPR
eukprot:gene8206-1468_t